MFGKKTQKKESESWKSIVLNFPPRKKELKTMLSILEDIERYDNQEEIEVRNNSIDSLIQYLQKYKDVVYKTIEFEKPYGSNPHTFCETPSVNCTLNFCDENGCQNRKRTHVEENQTPTKN